METTSIVIGGIGLFLLGMILMTDGLKAVAGESLRTLLQKFTGGLFTSICSGTILTAIIQSSSATMLMTIGFVSAGLLTFTQSVGIVFGANLGSSTIGWIVSFIGLKVSVGSFALPLIGVGAIWRFLFTKKHAAYGTILAGFGLIFLGIGTLQDGMSGVAEAFSFSSLDGDKFLHQIALLLIGLVMTVILQSSSTALVITLTALAAQALSFEQAALLVIGQNIGTTVKAFFVTIGGTVQAKRTAMAHILFNVIAGVIAFLGLPLFIKAVKFIGDKFLSGDQTIMLALFSTLFYIVGIILIVPFLSLFIKLITRIVPEKGDSLTKYLGRSVAAVPPIAIEAIRRTLIRVTRSIALVGEELYVTKQLSPAMITQLEEINIALNETRKFSSQISGWSNREGAKEYNQQVALVHAIDHLGRLAKAIGEEGATDAFKHEDPTVVRLSREMTDQLMSFKDLSYERNVDLLKGLKATSLELADLRRLNRKEIIKKTVLQQADVDAAINKVHALHWIDRVAYHLWRSMHHLDNCFAVENGEELDEE
ncbi:Na/Pi cotransporter family protein [Sporosarcina sp. CAU 1771]